MGCLVDAEVKMPPSLQLFYFSIYLFDTYGIMVVGKGVDSHVPSVNEDVDFPWFDGFYVYFSFVDLLESICD